MLLKWTTLVVHYCTRNIVELGAEYLGKKNHTNQPTLLSFLFIVQPPGDESVRVLPDLVDGREIGSVRFANCFVSNWQYQGLHSELLTSEHSEADRVEPNTELFLCL